ncbi:hypothetical protein AWB78_04378 [Caballeronia calidae]|uniref:Uncharacterized protein n=1 Tax=Caballeronia calidae TaxID=1777139 RepID=A0A158CWC1_9BURK|nr:hypothetical protein AWB78_04378 [Caballeronia calidae]
MLQGRIPCGVHALHRSSSPLVIVLNDRSLNQIPVPWRQGFIVVAIVLRDLTKGSFNAAPKWTSFSHRQPDARSMKMRGLALPTTNSTTSSTLRPSLSHWHASAGSVPANARPRVGHEATAVSIQAVAEPACTPRRCSHNPLHTRSRHIYSTARPEPRPEPRCMAVRPARAAAAQPQRWWLRVAV